MTDDRSNDWKAPDEPGEGQGSALRAASASGFARTVGPDDRAPIDFRVGAAVAGDAHAQRELWEEHRRWVAAILLAHKPKWADVEDLLQDVAMAFVRKVRELRDPGALKPWLRTVAVNTAHAAGRSGKLRPRAVGGADRDEGDLRLSIRGPSENRGGLTDDHEPAPGRLGESQEARRVLDLASKLSDGYREPLLLKAIQGLSYREIGRILNLPETTIETRIARARKQLRQLVSEAEEVENA